MSDDADAFAAEASEAADDRLILGEFAVCFRFLCSRFVRGLTLLVFGLFGPRALGGREIDDRLLLQDVLIVWNAQADADAVIGNR